MHINSGKCESKHVKDDSVERGNMEKVVVEELERKAYEHGKKIK
jgi:hypothetical protein